MTNHRGFRNTLGARNDVNEETDTSGSRKIAPDTIKQYHGFVKTLRRSFQNSNHYAELQTVTGPIDLVEHLYIRAKKGELRPKTFVNYRSALLYWLSTISPCPEVDSARHRLKTEFPKTGFKSSKPGGNKDTLYSTRSSRKRTFRRRDFERLTRELERRIKKALHDERMTPRAYELLVWLHAGLASGLRPIEWETAKWTNRAEGELLVQTAKTKLGGFALPSLQHLPAPQPTTRVVTIDAEQRVWVDQQLAAVHRHLSNEKPFPMYYTNNRLYLRTVCHDVFGHDCPAPFTLYTMRGQFAANRKKSNGLEATAGEMGCSPNVASTHYGSRIHAHRGRDVHSETYRPAREKKQGQDR